MPEPSTARPSTATRSSQETFGYFGVGLIHPPLARELPRRHSDRLRIPQEGHRTTMAGRCRACQVTTIVVDKARPSPYTKCCPRHRPKTSKEVGTMGRHHRPMHTDSAKGISSGIHRAMWVGSCSESLVTVRFGTRFFGRLMKWLCHTEVDFRGDDDLPGIATGPKSLDRTTTRPGNGYAAHRVDEHSFSARRLLRKRRLRGTLRIEIRAGMVSRCQQLSGNSLEEGSKGNFRKGGQVPGMSIAEAEKRSLEASRRCCERRPLESASTSDSQ
jgi:hypothetical protein